MLEYFPMTLRREELEGWVVFTWVLWSLITHLLTHSYRQREGSKKERASYKPEVKWGDRSQLTLWVFIRSCVREESECCHPTHSLILIEIYVCLDLTHLTGVCWAMSVTRCDTVTHGADHTHDVGSVSANQRPVWRLLTNERPVKWPGVTTRGWGMLGMLHWISTKRRTRLTQSEASVSSIWPMREQHLLWRGCTGSLVSHLSRQL